MRKLEYHGDGWWPRWSPDAAHTWVAFGSSTLQVWHRASGAMTQIATGAMCLRWIGPHTLTYLVADPSGLTAPRYEVVLDPTTPASPIVSAVLTDDDPALTAGNEFEAGAGIWASWLAAPLRLCINGHTIHGEFYGCEMNHHGHVLTCWCSSAREARGRGLSQSVADRLRALQSRRQVRRRGPLGHWRTIPAAVIHTWRTTYPTTFRVYDGDGRLIGEIPLPPTANTYRLSDTDVISFGYWGPAQLAYLNGVIEDVTITPWRQEGVPALVDVQTVQDWLWRPTEDPATLAAWMLGHPHGDQTVIAIPKSPVVDYDVACDGVDWLIAACSDRGALLIDVLPIGTPRVEIDDLFPSQPPDAPPTITMVYTPATGPAPLTVAATATPEAGSGPIDRYDWLSRALGVSTWNVDATTTAPTYAYRFGTVGTYEIGVRAHGPGGTGQTGAQRLVTVTADVPEPEPEPLEAVTLRTSAGVYLTAEDGGGPHASDGLLTARSTTADAWQTFGLRRHGDDTVSFRSSNGFWLSAEDGGGRELRANRPAIGPWEIFTPWPGEGSSDPDKGDRWVALQADTGQLVHPRPDGTVRADSLAIHAEETLVSSVSLFAPPVTPPVNPIRGRLRTASGRWRDDAGFVAWHGLSEFSFVHLARTGQLDELRRRLDRAQAAQRTIVRVLMMASNLFDLQPSYPGYWDAVDTVDTEATARGIRVEWVLFADAQDVLPDHDDRADFVETAAVHLRDSPGAYLQLANEPDFNGFDSAVDPELLGFADQLAALLGHRDFSVGDPPDGDNVDASQDTIDQSIQLAPYATGLVIHSSRLGGAEPHDDGRVRRWVDHLEGYVDVVDAANHDVVGCHDEPMGAANQQWVDLGGGKFYEREPNAAAHFAAAATAQFIGCGYTYHYISEQDDGLPGLDVIAAWLTPIPMDPSWRYYNDSWQGGATRGFTWRGGKCRTWSNGAEAYVLIYGSARGSITWQAPFTPDDRPLVDLAVQDDHGWVYAQLWKAHAS